MEKIIRHFPIPFSFDWSGENEISKLKTEIEELENLGVTHICIDVEDSDEAYSLITFKAMAPRLETDAECEERINLEIRQNMIKEKIKKMEIERYNHIKEKYNL